MNKSAAATRPFAAKERGAILSEYALVVVLIAVVCVVAVASVGMGARGLWVSACNAVSTAVAGAPAC